MSLAQELSEFKQGFLAQAPSEVVSVMTNATEQLAASGILDKALKVGDTLPEVTLPNHKGESVSLKERLAQGPLVVAFYRGGWCPYCNIELRALQAKLDEITAAGGALIAITPELPDASLSTVEANELAFDVLTDQDAAYARQLGLVFSLPEELRPIYKSFGIDVEKHNGQGQFDLPLAATYVIAQDGSVVSAFLDADYTQRQEPQDVVEVLKGLKA